MRHRRQPGQGAAPPANDLCLRPPSARPGLTGHLFPDSPPDIINPRDRAALGVLYRHGRYWGAVGWGALRHMLDGGGTLLAGHIAFATLFALFPFLIFLTTLAGELGQGAAADTFIALSLDSLPAEVRTAVEPAISEVLRGGRQGLMTISIFVSLWAVSSAIEAARYAFNMAYDVKQSRAIWWQRLQSLALVLFFSAGILLAMVLVIAAPFAWSYVELLGIERDRWRWLYRLVRFGVSILLMLGFVLPLYRWLPNARVRWREALPGALVAVLIWIVAAAVYSWYLQNLGRFTVTYGSLGGVVATLLFFYITALIVIFGAELNSVRRRLTGWAI
jgi:membrane protein